MREVGPKVNKTFPRGGIFARRISTATGDYTLASVNRPLHSKPSMSEIAIYRQLTGAGLKARKNWGILSLV
jgi:hypothetical protein